MEHISTNHRNKEQSDVISVAALKTHIASLRGYIGTIHKQEKPATRKEIQSEIDGFQQGLNTIETSLTERQVTSENAPVDLQRSFTDLSKGFDAFCIKLWGITPVKA